MKTKIALVLAAALIAILATGCKSLSEIAGEKLAETAVEKTAGGNVDVNTDDGSVSIKTEDGEFNIGSTKVPDSWPSSIPMYSGATVASSMTSTGSSGKTTGSIGLTTADAPSEVIAFYDSRLPSAWTKDPSASYDMSGNGATISSTTYKSTDNIQQVTVTASLDSSNNQTSISLMLTDTY